MPNSSLVPRLDTDTAMVEGPWVLHLSSGTPAEVLRFCFERHSHCLDVSFELGPLADGCPARGDLLCQDVLALEGMNQLLARLGYTGNAFGRAELGMQDFGLVVLEGSAEFADFAEQRGWWTSADEDYPLTKALRVAVAELPMLQGRLEFSDEAGNAFAGHHSMLLEQMLRAQVAERKQPTTALDLAALLNTEVLPALRRDPTHVIRWAKACPPVLLENMFYVARTARLDPVAAFQSGKVRLVAFPGS